jgi:cbb3-type cytochrome oxidase subunit 3
MKTRMLIFMSIFLLAVIFLFAEDVKKEISEKEVLKTLSGI